MVSSVSVPVQKLLPPNPLDQLGGCSPVGYPSWKLGTIALRRRTQWQPTPVLFPGKSHGWRSLVGCCPWGHKELDMTERRHSLIVSCIMTPTPTKYSQVRIPKSCECFLICKKKCFTIMIKLRLLRWRDYPGYLSESFFFFFSVNPKFNHKCPYKRDLNP